MFNCGFLDLSPGAGEWGRGRLTVSPRNPRLEVRFSGAYFFTAGSLVLFHHFGRFLLTGHIEPAPYPSVEGSHNSFSGGFRVDWEAVLGVAKRF